MLGCFLDLYVFCLVTINMLLIKFCANLRALVLNLIYHFNLSLELNELSGVKFLRLSLKATDSVQPVLPGPLGSYILAISECSSFIHW